MDPFLGNNQNTSAKCENERELELRRQGTNTGKHPGGPNIYEIGTATLKFTDYLMYLTVWKIIFVYILIVQLECLQKPECKCIEN